jgi:plastocyanin
MNPPVERRLRSGHACLACAAILAGGFIATQVRAASIGATVLDRAGRPVEDAVVTAVASAQPTPAGAPAAASAIIDQVDKSFVPYVAVMRAGTSVRFPNSDKIRHHVYSFSPAKRFELPLYAGKEAPPVQFDRVGIVVMGCNIHDWMVGYAYVVDTPYFAKTASDGSARIPGLPAGDYVVRIWHPEMDPAESGTVKPVHLDPTSSVRTSWTIDRLPALRPRRAPAPGSSPY